MRRSGIVLPVFAIAIFTLAIALPSLAGFFQITSQSIDSAEISSTFISARPMTTLLFESSAWALCIAFAAMLIGWVPGRVLRQLRHRRSVWIGIAVLLLLPLCLPPYAIFWSWWQAWPVGTALHRWAIEHDLIVTFRYMTLAIGLACWSWPLIAWCVAVASDRNGSANDLMKIDGAHWRHRVAAAWRSDARGLLLGGAVVFALTFNNTTCFDLAEVFTYGNELRAMEAMGVATPEIFRAAFPSVVTAAGLSIAVWLMLNGALRERLSHQTSQAIGWYGLTATICFWLLSVALPTWLVVSGMQRMFVAGGIEQQIAQFFDFYGNALLGSLVIAALTAMLTVGLALGLAMMWDDQRPWVRWLAHAQAIGWLIGAAIPGTIAGLAVIAAYNVPLFNLDRLLHTSGGSLIIGMVSRFGVVAVLLGRWLSAREPRYLHELRHLDGAVTMFTYIRATRPRLIGISIATFVFVAVLALSEIPVTATLRPARLFGGLEVITPSVLNAMHYQQPRTVILAIACFLIGAIIAAGVLTCVSLCVMRGRPRAIIAFLLCSALCSCLGGCDDSETPALRTSFSFGTPGMALGQMSYPRGIAADENRNLIYVIDKTARIQQFSFDGEPILEWEMPEKANGQPVGLSVDARGYVWVADTHYHRVLVFDTTGKEVLRFGTYGEGAGQFVYVTDIAFGPNDLVYVAEYGGNDRVQVFDREGQYQFEFGEFGWDEGEFNRPQSLVFNSDKSELYITDACNHRIIVTDPQGKFLRHFGSAGRELGRLGYPYGLMLLPDGSILVSEFGNSRIQRLSASGEFLGVFGGVGHEIGRLMHPWSVTGKGKQIFVLDSGNNRVQVVERFQ